MRSNPSIHPLALMLIGTLIGLACGTINGLIISKGKVHPLITTLATLAIYRGLVVKVSGNRWINFSEFSKGVRLIARGNIFLVNNIVFTCIVVSLIFYYFIVVF